MKDNMTLGDRVAMAKFCLTSKRFTNGLKVREFEKKWAEWVGSKHALYVSSGSTANYLLLAAVKEIYGLKDGDKVLVPACTCCLLYTSPSPRDKRQSRMPSSA